MCHSVTHSPKFTVKIRVSNNPHFPVGAAGPGATSLKHSDQEPGPSWNHEEPLGLSHCSICEMGMRLLLLAP
jgi:hypothetical protein